MEPEFDPFEAIADLRAFAHKLVADNQSLRDKLERCRQTQEDIIVGAKMECGLCGGYKPCPCDKGYSS